MDAKDVMEGEVIVIGANHHNTLGIVRCLGKKRVAVDLILIGTGLGFVGKSKYVHRYSVFLTPQDVLSFLENHYSDEKRSIILSCSDDISSVLNDNLDSLKDRYCFFHCSKQGALTTLMDKFTQTLLAHKAGFSVPKSVKKSEINFLGFSVYPCIVKPLASIHGGKSLILCENVEELQQVMGKTMIDGDLLIQERIKIEHEIVILGLAIRGDVYTPGYIYKHREMIGGTTYAAVYPISELSEDIVNASIQLVKLMRYEGLFGIECVYDGNEYKFIEINLRNDATTYALAEAGVNLPYAYYLYLTSGDYKKKG